MSNDLQNAYQNSQVTTDYNPDGAVIAAFRQNGFFVVVADGIAYCPVTDGALPNKIRRRDSAHLTRQDAEDQINRLLKAEADCGGEVDFKILAPSFEQKYWRSAVVGLGSEILRMDPEDFRASCERAAAELDGLMAKHVGPSEAVYRVFKDRMQGDVDWAEWARVHGVDREPKVAVKGIPEDHAIQDEGKEPMPF